jgi:hypothetical protein
MVKEDKEKSKITALTLVDLSSSVLLLFGFGHGLFSISFITEITIRFI